MYVSTDTGEVTVNDPAELLAEISPEPARVNILLVDDNPGKLTAHEAVLSALGENIVTARSGSEALERLLRQEFAVILLDVNMPGMDGFETAELIRERPRFEQVPIIFITAYNTTDLDRLRGYKLGAVDYLFLPIVPEVLKAKVKAFVELAHQNRVIRRQAERLAFHNHEQARQLKTIQELNQTLIDANRELESFSYTISHDLRAPLRSLKGFSAHLLEAFGDKLGEEGRDCAERIHRAALSLDQLTQDLLKYSRVTRAEIRLQPVRIDALVDELKRMDPALHPPGVEISLEGQLHPVLAHEALLLQCLSNLVSNAVKFVRPGVKPRVRISTQPVGDRVRIWVEDNGIGISPEHHRRIFGLFERVGEVDNFNGTGVGLAIVARATTRMGGTCGVESVPGQGSHFWIELPSPAGGNLTKPSLDTTVSQQMPIQELL